jgi:hypothetical protein
MFTQADRVIFSAIDLLNSKRSPDERSDIRGPYPQAWTDHVTRLDDLCEC